jgi:hypothetical protein
VSRSREGGTLAHGVIGDDSGSRSAIADESEAAPWYGCAFGVRVAAPEALETLTESSADVGAPVVSWSRVADPEELAGAWPGVGVERLVGASEDGDPMMSVDVDAGGAYLVQAPGYGKHVVSANGLRITSVLRSDAPWNWQRLFVAQALPLAAMVRGLEPLHASAVSFDGRAVAISAPSGTGKTSIAMHLVARGGALLTDDVLVVEPTPSGVQAHPGARLLSAHPHELAAVPTAARERLGTVLEIGEKVYLRVPLESEPRLLIAVYRLIREPACDGLRIIEEAPANPRDLLAMTFLTYVKSRERQIRHLELASCLAHRTRVFAVRLPPDLPAVEAATLLEQHVRTELGVAAHT